MHTLGSGSAPKVDRLNWAEFRRRWTDPSLLLRTISRPVRAALLSTLVAGFFTNVYFFTNRFTNEDDLHALNWSAFSWVNVGRPFYGILLPFYRGFPVPAIMFVVFLLAYTVGAAAVCSMLGIRRIRHAILLGICLVTFPSIAVQNGFLFAADSFAQAFLFACLAAWTAWRWRWGFIVGAVFLAVSLGTYQAFVGLALGLMMIDIICRLLDPDQPAKAVLARLGRYGVTAALGGMLYWVIVQVSTRLSGVTLSDYQGLNSMFDAIKPAVLWEQVRRAYRTFAQVFGYQNYYVTTPRLLVAITWLGVALTVVVVVRHSFGIRRPERWTRLGCVVLVAALIPLLLNVAAFMQTGGRRTTIVMVYPSVLAIALAVVLVDRFARQSDFTRWPALGAAIVALALSLNNAVIESIYYLEMDIAFQRTFALTNRITTRTEPYFDQTKTIALIGKLPSSDYPDSTVTFFNVIAARNPGVSYQYIGYGIEAHATYKFVRQADLRLGVRYDLPTLDQFSEAREFSSNMTSWPAEGSVELHDNVIVVKLSDPDPEVVPRLPS